MTLALLIIVGYLIGSIPFGVLVGRLRGFDPRAVGSGNIGMANVARAGGASAAALTFIGDALKGAVPVLIARAMGEGASVLAWAGFAAFVGSICSVFLRFRGGKGVSAALGVWAALAPTVLPVAIAVFVVVFALSRINSLSSMGAAISLPPTVAAFALPQPYLLLAIVMTALVLFRHQENIRRLARGDEPRLKLKGRD
jgi:acyl phosphate:glycerol-3-phosphate acyltransferase